MGKYDKNNIHDWVVKKLPKNPVIIEAGVYDGSDTAWFATKFPEGQIYGFEPLDEPFNMAYNRLNHFPNVTLSKYALGPKTGNGIMHECDWKSGSSSLRKPTGTLTFHPSILGSKRHCIFQNYRGQPSHGKKYNRPLLCSDW